MTQLDKAQLAVINCITDIGSGSSRRSLLAAAVAAGALSVFPMGSFGYAEVSSFNDLFVNFRAEDDCVTIHPFRVNFPKADIVGLHRRVAPTPWPNRDAIADQSQGVQLATRPARLGTLSIGWRKRWRMK